MHSFSLFLDDLTIFPHSGEMTFGNWWCSHRFVQPHATQQSQTVSKHFPFWHSVHADTTNTWDGVYSNSRSSCIMVHKARKSRMKTPADLDKYKGSISVSKIGPLTLGPPRTQRKRQEVTPSFTKALVPVTMAKSCSLLTSKDVFSQYHHLHRLGSYVGCCRDTVSYSGDYVPSV